ncbi:MAG: methyltransferase domain-containing protein [candidate division Zixibacteria bacterium]|nr:methyltransferase domain-containing protein [candidate division Zixibacteria bacterium]
MNIDNKWTKFFDVHAPFYMQNSFTQNTEAEVDFLVEEFKLPKGSSILDIGCGTGRHSIELATRGYNMTGVDLSKGMLIEAKENAKRADVDVDYIQSDAVEFRSDEKFDGAICLCEGAFCLLNIGDDPLERDLLILKNINNALKPSAKLIMTVLNGFRFIRMYNSEEIERGKFDPINLVEYGNIEVDSPEGKLNIKTRERAYIPTELKMMLKLAGFSVDHIGGGTAGNWGKRPIDPDEMEIMVIASKVSDNQ